MIAQLLLDVYLLNAIGQIIYRDLLPETHRPSSIFDRKKDERSDYLKARGNTIQKAFGENPF